jgi:hypothetical protein
MRKSTLALALAALASPAHAQLLVGQDSGGGPIKLGDVSSIPTVSYADLIEFQVNGAAGRPEGGVYLCSGWDGDLYIWDLSSPPQFLVRAQVPGLGGLGYGNGKLYGFGNFATPMGIYEINPATGASVLKVDTSASGLRFFALDYNQADGLLYGFSEYGNSGLYSINPETGAMVRLAGTPPGSYGMFRGMAVGNNTAYMVAAHPTDSFWAYDIAQGVGGSYTAFTNPYPESINGGGAWIGPPPANQGACCRPDGVCILTTSTGCLALNGIYRGDGSGCATANCPPPPTGACCLDIGCAVLTQAQCVGQNGTYRGDNTACATANCPPASVWLEQGDAGDLPSTAQVVSGPAGAPLTAIRGVVASGGGEPDMYAIQICDPTAFRASTVGSASFDTALFLFNASGHGVTFADDSGAVQSTITSQFIPGSGLYYVAVSGYDNDPLGATTAGEIWLDQPWGEERQPDGPAAAEAVGSWSGGGATGTYSITLLGTCFVSAAPACYANCDSSTIAPILNVNDFICFGARFAAGEPYANCDGSTSAPVLNVNDFVCFLNKFATGCR